MNPIREIARLATMLAGLIALRLCLGCALASISCEHCRSSRNYPRCAPRHVIYTIVLYTILRKKVRNEVKKLQKSSSHSFIRRLDCETIEYITNSHISHVLCMQNRYSFVLQHKSHMSSANSYLFQFQKSPVFQEICTKHVNCRLLCVVFGCLAISDPRTWELVVPTTLP